MAKLRKKPTVGQAIDKLTQLEKDERMEIEGSKTKLELKFLLKRDAILDMLTLEERTVVSDFIWPVKRERAGPATDPNNVPTCWNDELGEKLAATDPSNTSGEIPAWANEPPSGAPALEVEDKPKRGGRMTGAGRAES